MGDVIIGAQWGDEGKGKIIDILAAKADVVVRSQGGNNAGHTVVSNGKTYKLHLVPSGILYPEKLCLIGAGVVLDPKSFIGELVQLKSQGIEKFNLLIDYRAHIVMPWHIELDGLSEKYRGKSDIGTTKKGIGPAYTDKYERSGLRLYDLIHPEIFREKAKTVGELKNRIITEIYGGNELDIDKIIEEYIKLGEKLKDFADDVSYITYEAHKAGKKILFEGAQATLLDIDFGTYPYVTSSHPNTGGVCTGTGIGPRCIDEVIGVVKAYTTRVGKGPFPTELDDEIGERIRNVGGEFGTTTGRPRRTGWFDAVIAEHSIRVNGITALALNKLDTLGGLEKIKICTGYVISNETQKLSESQDELNICHRFPCELEELQKCEPVYEELDGFAEDISSCKTFEKLPQNCKKYIERIEQLLKTPVKFIGVGPDRSQCIYR
ncbi:adenylosuccinate synthetase [Clostridia bacterium]|nr:adenylosuccinate synthetase [Clostridia bacterium]